MRKIIAALLVVLFFGFGFFLFFILGGFNDILVEKVEGGKLELSGIHFRGTPQDAELREAFQTIEKIQRDYPSSKLHTIYYSEPAGKLDTIEVFVGLEKEWLQDKPGMVELSFSSEDFIVATVQAHRFVMPGPLKVKSKIMGFAEENGMPEPDIFIDKIVGSDEVKVIALKK